VRPRTGLDGCGKSRPPPGFHPLSVHPVAAVAIPTALPQPTGIFVYVKQRDDPYQVTTQYKAHFPGDTKENNLEAPVHESRSAFFEPGELPITSRIVHHRNAMFDTKQTCNFVTVVFPEVL
jgi:hypothetical protein